MFESLPEELLREVRKSLSTQDLKTLTLVSKSFHGIWAPRFWNTLYVDTASPTDRPSSVSISRIKQCTYTLQNASSCIQNVVDLVFRRDIRWKLWDYEKEEDWPNVACLHRQPPPEDYSMWMVLERAAPVAGWSGDTWSSRNRRCVEASIEGMGKQPDPDPMNSIALATQSIIERIPVGQLRSFTWDLAACTPQAVFDILFRTQPQLESISLTGDACCKAVGEDLRLPFTQLSRINLNSLPRSYLLPVRSLLETNRRQLRDLQIEDLADGCSLEELFYGKEGCQDATNEDPANESDEKSAANPAVLFPSLATLSLRGIVLTKRVDRAFNLSGLRALTLRHCSQSSGFLERAMTTKSSPQLKTFEFKSDHGSGDEDYDSDSDEKETNTVNDFLLSFEGLNNLFIGFARDLCGTEDSDYFHPLWSTVGHHGSTLKKLVIHQRGIWRGRSCSFGIERNIDHILDVNDNLGIPERIINKWMMDSSTNPLSALPKLECLGLPCAVSDWEEFDTRVVHTDTEVRSQPFIVTLLTPFTYASRRLKLLHLRQTGSNVRKYDSWAFKETLRPPPPGLGRRRVNPDNPKNYDARDLVALTPAEVQSMLEDDFARFLDWTFGPNGILSLQAVAFGDFANGHMSGKYLHNIFACRSSDEPYGYRVFDCRDKGHKNEWRDVADEYADFLESCPVGPRVEGWQHGSRYHF
ncbi:hypothetical protein QBC41DRAFT_325147 [Cercophora samala]|uniref:F-box domain-containing protein n=1 Tax=Cercophora samala TaxID=330535 RepID=A0AA39Z9K1_9PEZI|nr:hypothetical protein QBC41DRAFT_325147 [Cercophora samala]